MPPHKNDGREGFDRYTLRRQDDDTVDVLGWGIHPRGSVLEGQPRKVFMGNFDSVEKAQELYPKATEWSNRFTDPEVNLSHLPGEDDPVPGGMHPDDWPSGDDAHGTSRFRP